MGEAREVHIEVDQKGVAQRFDVGGFDLAGLATALSLSMRAGDIPQLTLTLPVIRGGTFHGERIYVEVDRLTAEALKALGWTPPDRRRRDG